MNTGSTQCVAALPLIVKLTPRTLACVCACVCVHVMLISNKPCCNISVAQSSGWQPIAPRGSSSSNAAEGGPGFPALEALHVDIALTAPSGGMLRHTGASFVTDAVLLQLAGKSTQLMVLDLSGSQVGDWKLLVTADGLLCGGSSVQ